MGSKTRARELMSEAGLPIVPGTTPPGETRAEAKKEAKAIGYPVACQAAGGAGGPGVRVERSVRATSGAVDTVAATTWTGAGQMRWVSQAGVELRGHAIACRISAEAAQRSSAPAPGRIAS